MAAVTGGVTNGLVGAWGPVATPFLLHRGLEPLDAVGGVNTAEIAVAFVAVGTFPGSTGGEGVEAGLVVAMLLGGVAAAPLAAYVVRFSPPRLLGLAVAGPLLVTQSRELAGAVELPVRRWLVAGSTLTGLLESISLADIVNGTVPQPAAPRADPAAHPV